MAWLLAITVLVMSGITLVWFLDRTPTKLHPDQTPAAAHTPSRLLPTTAVIDPARTVREQTVYWEAHKDHLRQLLVVDYPAAVAQREARFPEVAAVVKFGQEYAGNFERQNQGIFLRAEEQDKQHRAKLQELKAHQPSLPSDLLLYERWLADTRPIPGNQSISSLTRLHGPDGSDSGRAWFQSIIARTEGQIFGNEAAAKHVGSLQTSQELVDYVLAARGRWDTAQIQMYLDAGYDPQVAEYMIASQCAAMVGALTENYERQSHQKLDAIDRESDAILQAMHEPELAAASRDDPEARRLLTELQEMVLLRQRQKAGS